MATRDSFTQLRLDCRDSELLKRMQEWHIVGNHLRGLSPLLKAVGAALETEKDGTVEVSRDLLVRLLREAVGNAKALGYRDAEANFAAAEILRPEGMWCREFERRRGRKPRVEERYRGALDFVYLTRWLELHGVQSKTKRAVNRFWELVKYEEVELIPALELVAAEVGYKNRESVARVLRREHDRLAAELVDNPAVNGDLVQVLSRVPHGQALDTAPTKQADNLPPRRAFERRVCWDSDLRLSGDTDT